MQERLTISSSPPISSQVEHHATVKEMAGRVQVDTSMLPHAIPRSPLARLRRWYRNSLLRLLVLEGNAIPRRIGWIRQIRAVERQRGKDSVRQWVYQGQAPTACTSAYIQYMQQTETLHPFLSIFEMHLVSRAWMAGVEYGIHKDTQHNLNNEPCNCLSNRVIEHHDASYE
jgi:hypothetical protein